MLGLTNSIIQARRCRRVTVGFRSSISARSRPSAIRPDFKSESEAHAQRCFGTHVNKTEFRCQSMLCLVVVEGFDVLSYLTVASTEVSVRLALPRPVLHLLYYRQVLRMVLDRFVKVPHRLIRAP